MFKRIRQFFIASYWQKRARRVFFENKDKGWDCSDVSQEIFKEMETEGLRSEIDFVVVYANTPGGVRHLCLEMYGKNSQPYKINGYRIDGTYNGELLGIWKGEYL